MKYTYHPKSWSQQARELSNKIIENINAGEWSVEYGFFWLRFVSYRHIVVRRRAIARLRRYFVQGKLHETVKAITNGYKWMKEASYLKNNYIR